MKKENKQNEFSVEDVKDIFLILSSGKTQEVREAKRKLKRIWSQNHKIFVKSKKVIFEVINKFDRILDPIHKAAVISGMDLFFLTLADDNFDELRNFIIKNLQHPDGRVREAARKTGDWLYVSLTARISLFEKQKLNEGREVAIQQYLDLVMELEDLIDEYDDDIEKVNYIDDMKPSVNKSLQMFWVRLVDSPVYKEIRGRYTPIKIVEFRKQIETDMKLLLQQFGSDSSFENIKEIIYNESGQHDLEKVLKIFENVEDIDELNEVMEMVSKAWNYFPHKCLNGLSPVEVRT